ncbi:hypothetical protein GGR44_001652 [Sphingobium fontiphilum]|uniref:Uncharacterized protein n=1 Tax=Sphingobium fontiphilum TaxID=944425 RepID=A0A7W6GP47_9SPHN|nr:hypothetical protein [Sphingobium fontiphilum]MBB3981993.1 hypothetical protein [Sphingobium fontiphilum]
MPTLPAPTLAGAGQQMEKAGFEGCFSLQIYEAAIRADGRYRRADQRLRSAPAWRLRARAAR